MSKIEDEPRSSAARWRPDVEDHVDAIDRRLRRRRLTKWTALGGVGAAAIIALLLVVLVGRGGGGSTSTGNSQSSCAAPTLRVSGSHAPATLTRGSAVVLVGRYYVDGCQDTVNEGAPAPFAHVDLALTPSHGSSIPLTTASPAGDLGTFKINVTIPKNAPTGRVVITDGGLGAGASVIVK